MAGNSEIPNPVSTSYPSTQWSRIPPYPFCKWFRFWWDTNVYNNDGKDGTPIEILGSAFPGTTGPYRSEFTLLDKQTNNLKLAYFSLP